MMEYYRDLELTLVSGLDIGPGGSTGRPEAYAKVSLRGTAGMVYQSNVDTIGGTNPIWNFTCCLELRDSSVREPGVEVVVKLYYRKIVEDLFVGEVHIPIPALFDRGISASAAFNVVPTGSLNISFRFGQKYLQSNRPYRRRAAPDTLSFHMLAGSKFPFSLPEDSEDEGFENLLSDSDTEDHSDEIKDEAADGFQFGTRDGGKIKEMNDEAKSDRFKRFLEDFILFCSVFPLDYEFTKDVLVCQWIARRLIELGEDEEMEVVCTEECVDTLVDKNYIISSGYDYVLDQTKYKISDEMTTFLQNQLLKPKVGKYLDSKHYVLDQTKCKIGDEMDSKQSHHDPSKIELLSLSFKETDHAVLKQYSRLHTLVIHDQYKVDHLPSDIFSELKALKILILSRTSIVELPKSVENLKELLFLDMSETPLIWLPEIVLCFTQLQILRLDGCLQLEGLPEGTSYLINLRHLILDVVLQLDAMPVGIGKLSKLRTLSAFLVGEEEGCSVRELKDMNKLRGSFRLLNLENIKTKEEASEAYLHNKVDLRKIELQWSDVEGGKIPHEEEILESLKPHVGIQELKILFYSGEMLPSWICDPSFNELVTISLYKCRYCVCLPSLGELPSLKHLSIIENEEVVEIGSSFGRKKRNQYHAAFPKLEKLTFESMSRLEKWTGLERFNFPSLRHLIVQYCPEFVELSCLGRLSRLSHLEIGYCPKFSLSPRDRLPTFLQSLMIKESPRLKEWCSHENWSRIADVTTVYFDHQKFLPEMELGSE